MQQDKKIARNYAQALIEAANKNLELQDTFISEIKILLESFKKVSNAKQVFNNPVISKEEKKKLIKRISGLTKQVTNFLFLLIDNRRFNLLPEIHDQMVKIVNKEKGIAVAEVSSASELDNDTLNSIKQKLESVLGSKGTVTIDSTVDPSLIGGVKVKVNDLVYDGSIKGRLENLKHKLLQV